MVDSVVENKRSSAGVILLYAMLFLFIYGPPFRFFPVNISLLLSTVLLSYFFLPISSRVFSLFKIELFLLLGICFYAVFISLLNGAFYISNVLLNTPIVLLFFNIPVCFILYRIFIRSVPLRYESDHYAYFVITLSNLAVFSSFLTLVFWLLNDVGEYVKFDLLKYDSDLMVYQSHRAYGLSDELLFSYSIVQASIFLLALDKFGFGFRTFVLLSSVTVSIGLNARIGFLILALMLFIPNFWSLKSFLGVILFFASASYLYSVGQDDIVFIFDQFFYFLSDISGYSDASSTEYLLDNMIFMPEGFFSALFGMGINIFGGDGGSDSGYVLLLFYGGFFYIFMLLVFLLYISTRFIGSKYFVPVSILVVVFLISNIKGLYFAPKPGMHLFVVVYVFLVLFAKLGLKGGFK